MADKFQDKGREGELIVIRDKLLHLDSSVYRDFNDVTFLNATGHTIQIDHIFVSIFGVFVLETKNWEGTIYGYPDARQWKQYRFGVQKIMANPIRQNYGHIKELQKLLNLPEAVFHSVIVFPGNTVKLPSDLPPNVVTHDFWSYIKSKQEVLLSDDQVNAVCASIEASSLPKSEQTMDFHLASVATRHPEKIPSWALPSNQPIPLPSLWKENRDKVPFLPSKGSSSKTPKFSRARRPKSVAPSLFAASLLLALFWIYKPSHMNIRSPVQPVRAEVSNRTLTPPPPDADTMQDIPMPFPQSGTVTYLTNVDQTQLVSGLKLVATRQYNLKYVIKLTNLQSNTPFMLIYLTPGEVCEFGLPVGPYQLSLSYGTQWYGHRDLFRNTGREFQPMLNLRAERDAQLAFNIAPT